MSRLLALAATLVLMAGPAFAADVVDEAKAFMAAYAQDLAKGDRAAVAARYDRQGAHFVFAGEREFQSYPKIVADYTGRWTPPKTFAWKDLAYEAAGPDAVVVTGAFLWDATPIAYTGFLHRQDGVLRIRLEHETPEPPPAKPAKGS